MKFVLASHNKKKIKELYDILQSTLPGIEVISISDAGITEEIEENGTTFEENALIKARVAAGTGFIGVADDSGLCVDALKGAPGVYSARYSGMGDKANNEKLVRELEGKENRGAKFVSAIACVLPDGREFTVRGEVSGVILDKERGEGGFGYDPLFYIPSLEKTFAQLDSSEKNRISHRGKALALFAEEIKKYLS